MKPASMNRIPEPLPHRPANPAHSRKTTNTARATASIRLAHRAWAGNTINTAIFRHHGLLTVGRLQYCAFYVDSSRLRIVRRTLNDGSVTAHDLPGRYDLLDAHNSISLGCDRDGVLHLAYGCHSSAMRYRRSLSAGDIERWTAEIPLGGAHESHASYPTFLLPPNGGPLLLLYRDGISGNGAARLKQYSEREKVWLDLPRPVLTGAGNRPWTSSPYWNRPAFDRDGNLHLSFVWRTRSIGRERRVNNLGIGYAKSADGGRRWLTSGGWPLATPITQVNAETVLAVPPGANLINQTGMATDGAGHPHIVFYANDPDGIPQYQHLWWDGRRWRHQMLSTRTSPFALEGNGTLQIPISRPEILIDASDRAYVVYRGDLSGDRMVAQQLLPPHYAPNPEAIRVLWDEPLGFSEPVVDMPRWQRHGMLSMLIQKNLQPPHDRDVVPAWEPVDLIDIDLAQGWESE